MTYSSALFAEKGENSVRRSLQEAQIAKYENLCRKLELKESDSILEIGSGWGGFAVYAVEKYGCRYTGLTISKEQLEYAENLVRERKLSDKIKFNLVDYRSFVPEGGARYNKIVSIEMIEAVGHEYYEVYFQKIDSLLARDGLAAIQMITSPDSRYDLIRANTDFIQKHIFPGSLLPSLARINQATARTELFLHDLEDMGNDYARTLVTWQERFDERLPEVMALGF
jgi:Cyclopropane fatty acid synthase and related methyltransferases